MQHWKITVFAKTKLGLLAILLVRLPRLAALDIAHRCATCFSN